MIAVDLDSPSLSSNASLAAGSSVAVITVPLASAKWPLQAGRIVSIDVDIATLDSSGVAMGAYVKAVIPPGLAPNTVVAASGAPNDSLACQEMANVSTPIGGSGSYASTFSVVINASGDLDVRWANGLPPGSTNTQDVSVRVRYRWLGA